MIPSFHVIHKGEKWKHWQILFSWAPKLFAESWLSAPNAKQKYGDRVMKEKWRLALLLCQTKEEHSRLVPQELCPHPWWTRRGYIVRQGYVIRIKAVTRKLLSIRRVNREKTSKQKIRSVVFPLWAQVGFAFPNFLFWGCRNASCKLSVNPKRPRINERKRLLFPTGQNS